MTEATDSALEAKEKDRRAAILIAILFSSKFRPKFFTIAACRSDGKIAAVETNPEGL